jgi:3-deoxy-D-manno-octulosonate 8-phosphate phosphatase (KDO 8-P phosphatase)
MTPQQRAARIQLMVLDVDGVMTDGRLYYGAQGETLKVFDVRDGHGIRMLLASGVDVALLSARHSEIVALRARELGIPRAVQGVANKAVAFDSLLKESRLHAEQTGFIGDDLPDLPVLRMAGFAATVADAREEIKAVAHWIAPCPGGQAAVRALADFVLHAKGIDLTAMVQG